MKLVKKPVQNLDLTVKSHSQDVSYSKNGIIIAANTFTKNVVDGVKQISKSQTCFKLKVVNSPALAAMFI